HANRGTRTQMRWGTMHRMCTAPHARRGRRDSTHQPRRLTIRTLKLPTHTPHLQPKTRQRHNTANTHRHHRDASLKRLVGTGAPPPPPSPSAPPLGIAPISLHLFPHGRAVTFAWPRSPCVWL